MDEFLQWEPEDYDGVDIVSLRNEDLWMPDVTTYERYAKVLMLFIPPSQ